MGADWGFVLSKMHHLSEVFFFILFAYEFRKSRAERTTAAHIKQTKQQTDLCDVHCTTVKNHTDHSKSNEKGEREKREHTVFAIASA